MRNETAVEQTRLLTPQPLYGQVRQALLDHIRKGEWMVGDPLPNEAFLAKRFGVSIGTVRKAMEALESNGLVKRIQGRGTYVAGVGSHVLKEKFTRLRGIDGQPVELAYELLMAARTRTTTAAAAALGLPEDADVFEVRQRLKCAGGVAGVEVSYLRSGDLPNFLTQVKFGQDLYPLYADYGLIVTHASEHLSLTPGTPELAEALELAPSSFVWTAVRLAYCLDRRPLEYRIAHYRADRVTYAALVD